MHRTYGWEKYLLIENDFLKAKQFADFTEKNFETTSLFFTNQVILLGAEIESAFKKICQSNNVDGGNIKQYKEEILKMFPKIMKYTCYIPYTNYLIAPFLDWVVENNKLKWWTIYTEVKHSVVDERATMFIALEMLSALQLLLLLIEAKSSSVPDANGNYSIFLFSNEIPKLLIPNFKTKTIIGDPGVLTALLIPKEDIC